MLTIFSRRELITLISMEKMIQVREALSGAGIESAVKTRGLVRGQGRGDFFIDRASACTYTIYVSKKEYEWAREVIRPALQENG